MSVSEGQPAKGHLSRFSELDERVADMEERQRLSEGQPVRDSLTGDILHAKDDPEWAAEGQPALTPDELNELRGWWAREPHTRPKNLDRLLDELAREREATDAARRFVAYADKYPEDIRGPLRDDFLPMLREALVGLPEGSERKAPKVCACPQARESDCLLVTLPDGREFHVRGASTIGQAVEALVGLPEGSERV